MKFYKQLRSVYSTNFLVLNGRARKSVNFFFFFFLVNYLFEIQIINNLFTNQSLKKMTNGSHNKLLNTLFNKSDLSLQMFLHIISNYYKHNTKILFTYTYKC